MPTDWHSLPISISTAVPLTSIDLNTTYSLLCLYLFFDFFLLYLSLLFPLKHWRNAISLTLYTEYCIWRENILPWIPEIEAQSVIITLLCLTESLFSICPRALVGPKRKVLINVKCGGCHLLDCWPSKILIHWQTVCCSLSASSFSPASLAVVPLKVTLMCWKRFLIYQSPETVRPSERSTDARAWTAVFNVLCCTTVKQNKNPILRQKRNVVSRLLVINAVLRDWC